MSAVKNKVTYKTAKALLQYGDTYKHIVVLLLRGSYCPREK